MVGNMAKHMILCDCMGTQSLDPEGLAKACGLTCSALHTSLCDTQIDAAALGSEERRMLETIKAELAGITMKLNTQRELSNIKGAQAMTPPTEPAGRAPAGRAFQQ